MVAQMYSGTEAKGPFGGGFAEENLPLPVQSGARPPDVAGGGVGIADAVYAEILKLQGGVK